MHRMLDVNFSSYTDVQFLAKSGTIFGALSKNPAFAGNWPEGCPNLAELGEAIDRYRECCRSAVERDLANQRLKKEARSELNKKLRRISEHVETVAGRNPLALLKTGFSLRGGAGKKVGAEAPRESGRGDTTLWSSV